MLGGSLLDIYVLYCRVVCFLVCWDSSFGVREVVEVWDVLLGIEGKGYFLLCKYIFTNLEKKGWRNMVFKVEFVCFFWFLLFFVSCLFVLVIKCFRKVNNF